MINLGLTSKIKALLTVLVAAVVLLLAVYLGADSGRLRAQARQIKSNAEQVAKGLEYFYADYGRFPSATEYQNRNLMLNYFNQFPAEDLVSKYCGQSYLYKRISGSSFQLNFCLPESVDQYKSGWNQINQDREF